MQSALADKENLNRSVAKKLCNKYVDSKDPETAAFGCLFCTLTKQNMDKKVDAVLRLARSQKYKLAAPQATACYALARGKQSFQQLTVLSKDSDELFRANAANAAAQFTGENNFVQIIVDLFKHEEETSILYNVIPYLNNWDNNQLYDAILENSLLLSKSKEFFNSAGAVAYFASMVGKKKDAEKYVRHFLLKNQSSLESRVERLHHIYQGSKNSDVFVKILGELLTDPTIRISTKASIGETLASYKQPNIVRYFESAIENCAEDCDRILWPIAQLWGTPGVKGIVQKALKSKDSFTSSAAAAILEFHTAKSKDKKVDSYLGMTITKDGKLLFDNISMRDKLVNMAAYSPQGISKKKLIEIIMLDTTKQTSLSWPTLMRALVSRFGADTESLVNLLPLQLNGKEILRGHLRQHPTKKVCQTFLTEASKNLRVSSNIYALPI